MASDPEIDERRFQLDAEIRRREIAIKEAEAKKSAGLTTAQATVAGAVLALLSGLVGSAITAWSSQNIESGRSLTSVQIEELRVKGSLDLERSKQLAVESLERKKFETSLILEAIKTPQRSDAIRNLKFFVAAGFVTDADGKIGKLSDENLPSISMPSAASANRALQATGKVSVIGSAGSPSLCTGVGVSAHVVLTASFCIDDGAKSVQFSLGERSYSARVLQRLPNFKLALLHIDTALAPGSFLDRSHVRDPVRGERVYFAMPFASNSSDVGQNIQIRVCEITENRPDADEFEHNCVTGPGSSGATIIAVSDDALLGIHHSRRSAGSEILPGGVAAKWSKAASGVSIYLSDGSSTK